MKICSTELIVSLSSNEKNEGGIRQSSFGSNLANLIRKKRSSPNELAKKTGLTPAFVEFLLSSRTNVDRILDRYKLRRSRHDLDFEQYTNPGLWVVRKICHALDADLEELVEIESTSTSRPEITRDLMVAAQKLAGEKDIRYRQFVKLEKELQNRHRPAAARSMDFKKYIEGVLAEIQEEDETK